MERWDRGDNLQRAIDAFTDATLANPDFALAYARLGDAQRMQYALGGDSSVLQTAMGHVQQAVRLNPDLAPVQTALGRIYYTQGNHDLAFAAIERALAIDPNDAGANQSIGSLYERQGRPEDAEAAFRKAVALDSDNPLPLDALANFLYRQGRYDEAIAQWQTLLRMAPDHYGALVNLGSAFSESGRMAEAITLFESAIEIRPNYMAYSNLGTALGRVGRLQEAEQAYLQAVAQPEADWLAWGNLGFIYSRMEDGDEQAGEAFERAIQLAEAARRQSPRDPYLFSDLALYSAKTGSDDVARQHIATALSLAAESGEIQALAASVFAILNDQSRAAEHYNEALALGYPETLLLADIELDALRDSL